MGDCFVIKIFDNENPDLIPIIEQTAKGSAVLSWQGTQEKDTPIIGSSLAFNMLDERFEDGRFFELYTGNESRYRVEVLKKQIQDNQEVEILFWKGFLLPEQYSEPYKNGQLFVNFLATCGLGRLRGKFLPDAYYQNEFTVVEFLIKCLNLTSNTANLYFCPAISSPIARFDAIYINGNTFSNGDTRFDAYKVLKTICGDLLCSIYMEFGNWFVIGYNKKGIYQINYQVYDQNAVYLYDKLITRKPIDIQKKALQTPQIGVVSPIKKIEVSHPLAVTEIPENVYKESRDGWLVINESIVEYLPRNLFLSGVSSDNWVFIDYDTGKLTLKGFEEFTGLNYLYLRDRIFVTAGQKINLSVALSIDKNKDESLSDEQLVQSGEWLGLIRISVVIDDYNGNIQRVDRTYDFGTDKSAKDSEDFVVLRSGYLDLLLYKPIGANNKPSISSIKVDEIQVSDIEYQENQTYEDFINEDFSIVKNIELVLNDDVRSVNNLLALEKQKVQDVFLYERKMPIRSSFLFNAMDYVVLDNFNIFLIVDNIEQVYVRANGSSQYKKVNDINVIYNFNNGDQNVFSYDSNALGFVISRFDDLKVDVYDFTYNSGDRSEWQKWQDDVYKTNSKRFGRTIADIYRRMYRNVHLSIDVSLLGIYSFSSLVKFRFKMERDFYAVRTSLNLSTGKTTAQYIETFYGADEVLLTPISVFAGADKRVTNPTIVAVNFNALASTTNSFLIGVQWEIISGEGFLERSNELAVTLYNFGRNTVLRVVVTDNLGQTASDEVSVVRVRNYAVNFVNYADTLDTFDNPEGYRWSRRTLKYALLVTKALENDIMTLYHRWSALMTGQKRVTNYITVRVFKNENEIYKNTLLRPATRNNEVSSVVLIDNFSISIVPGDFLIYEFELAYDIDEGPFGPTLDRIVQTQLTFNLYAATFQNESGTVTNLLRKIIEKFPE